MNRFKAPLFHWFLKSPPCTKWNVCVHQGPKYILNRQVFKSLEKWLQMWKTLEVVAHIFGQTMVVTDLFPPSSHPKWLWTVRESLQHALNSGLGIKANLPRTMIYIILRTKWRLAQACQMKPGIESTSKSTKRLNKKSGNCFVAPLCHGFLLLDGSLIGGISLT